MARALRPVFTFELNSRVLAGRITVGCYDGQRACLTVATPADKVLVHWPRGATTSAAPGRLVASETNREVATLNVGEPVEAILAACLLPNDEKDVLCIGTSSHVLVYHVYDNRDVFRRPCPDGAFTLATNSARSTRPPLLLVGGESAVRGLDCTGAEIFWIAVGDRVSAILLLPKPSEGAHSDPSDDELVIGATDRCIRLYHKGQLSAEHAETEAVAALAALPGDSSGRFAYALRNGTVGVYERGVRLWRVKSRGAPICLCVPAAQHLLAGWASGRVDWRRADTGELMLRDALSHSAAGIVLANYRATAAATTSRFDIICVTTNGEVRGYDLEAGAAADVQAAHPERDAMRDLLSQKQALLLELAHYESNARHNDSFAGLADKAPDAAVGVIPANTRLHVGLSTDTKSRSVQLSVSTTGENTAIRAVVVFAEGLFESEATVAHPARPAASIRVPLRPPTDAPVDLHVKALVGRPDATLFHVFELTRQLPRFAMYTRLLNRDAEPPIDSYVQLRVNDRVQRVCMWLNQNFLLDEDVEPDGEEETRVTMRCLRDDSPLRICIHARGTVRICSEHLRVAADLVRSLAGFLNVDRLGSAASFPAEEARVRRLMGTLPEVQEARTRLAADTAERLALVRALIVRAEDSRINAIDGMWRHYVQLQRLNEELGSGHEARVRNHREGAAAVKHINDIIQQASRLRVGAAAAQVVNLCRAAIRANNVDALIQAIRTGG